MTDMNGKNVLLTGGLGTLGQAQARRLTGDGAKVVILDMPGAENADQVVADIPGTRYFGCDLSDLAGAEAAVKALAADIGGFDTLINNAAMIIKSPLESYTLEQYEQTIRVNSSAPFALARACVPGMKERGAGRIVNFTSITLTGQWDEYVPYVTSKGAMYGLTKSLARELGPHKITVNAVSPGAIVSAAEQRVYADRLQEYNDWVLAGQCLKERVHPEDVADLVHFLVSDRARRITGQNLSIDGGW